MNCTPLPEGSPAPHFHAAVRGAGHIGIDSAAPSGSFSNIQAVSFTSGDTEAVEAKESHEPRERFERRSLRRSSTPPVTAGASSNRRGLHREAASSGVHMPTLVRPSTLESFSVASLVATPSPLRDGAISAVSSQGSVSVVVQLQAAPPSSTSLLYAVESDAASGPVPSPPKESFVPADKEVTGPSCEGITKGIRGGAPEVAVASTPSVLSPRGDEAAAPSPSTVAAASLAVAISSPQTLHSSCSSPLTLQQLPSSSAFIPSLPAGLPTPSSPLPWRAAAAVAVNQDSGAAECTAASLPKAVTMDLQPCRLVLVPPASEEVHPYEVDAVLTPEVTHAAMSERVAASVMDQLALGYSVCVLCDGSSGGKEEETCTTEALTLAVARRLFAALDVDNDVVEMSYIKVSGEKAYDCLNTARNGSFGTELSAPTAGHSSNVGGNNADGSRPVPLPEPKYLVRSCADVQSKLDIVPRLQATPVSTDCTLSCSSSTLLSLYITYFLDGTPIMTTCVTMVGLSTSVPLSNGESAGEEGVKAAGRGEYVRRLRQLCEPSDIEDGGPDLADALLASYLAPRFHTWHVIVLVAISLEADIFEDETEALLKFTADMRSRKVKKMRCRMADPLARASGHHSSRPDISCAFTPAHRVGGGALTEEGAADDAELHDISAALAYRIRVLEEASRLEEQRALLMETPLAGDGDKKECVSMDAWETSRTHAEALQRQSLFYRQVLEERQNYLRRLPLSLAPPVEHQRVFLRHSASPEGCSTPPQDGEASAHAHRGRPPAPLASLLIDGDSFVEKPYHRTSNADDAHEQLYHCLHQLSLLRSGSTGTKGEVDKGNNDSGNTWRRLHSALLRACEEYEDLRERLRVASDVLRGLRAQSHRRYDELLRIHKICCDRDAAYSATRVQLQNITQRANATELVLEEVRLLLFQTLAEQAAREELARLYAEERPVLVASSNAEDTSGARRAEQAVELEKVNARQHALREKITELMGDVEKLTRTVAQKEDSLTALGSIITPAQRALFYSMSNKGKTVTAQGYLSTAEPASAEDGGSAADCFSLLQSQVAELQFLLEQEQQRHGATQCELVEAREDAQRCRQEQRQTVFQQQEETRRVERLTVENYQLRRHLEQHQLHVSQLQLNMQKQYHLQRREHEAAVAALTREFAERLRVLERGNGRDGNGATVNPSVLTTVEDEEAVSPTSARTPTLCLTSQLLYSSEDGALEEKTLCPTVAATSSPFTIRGPDDTDDEDEQRAHLPQPSARVEGVGSVTQHWNRSTVDEGETYAAVTPAVATQSAGADATTAVTRSQQEPHSLLGSAVADPRGTGAPPRGPHRISSSAVPASQRLRKGYPRRSPRQKK